MRDAQQTQGGPPGIGGAVALPAGQAEDTLSIPNRHVGLIIGKGGEMIRGLQERSGAHIQVRQCTHT
jgi:polyribonucleotide nucleotidyltransferase